MPNKVKFKLIGVKQKAFDDIKYIIAHNTLLSYTDFNKRFDIHTDDINYQTGAFIIHSGKPINFYSRKLRGSQTRYTVTEKEFISIVDNLKEFRTILVGQHIKIYTDH